MACRPHGNLLRRCRAGFTLVELLVAVAILALLVSIATAGLANARAASRKMMCMNQFRDVVFRFGQFADPAHHPARGDSQRYGDKTFRLEDFQESLYRIDEFWDAGEDTQAVCDPATTRLVCPESRALLTRHKGLPCSQYAVMPVREISAALNMRLEYASQPERSRLKRVPLTSAIRDRPWVPLVLDVDGLRAEANGVMPYETAPPAGDTGLYGGGQFWFPSLRHGGKCNVGFIGGHVLSMATPERGSGSQWSYQPPAN